MLHGPVKDTEYGPQVLEQPGYERFFSLAQVKEKTLSEERSIRGEEGLNSADNNRCTHNHS